MMPQFLDPLSLTAVPPNKWKLSISFSYRTLIKNKPRIIKVPKGFPTNLASIPLIFRPLIPQNGKHRWAATVHDYLYDKKGRLGNQKYTRKECDRVFLEGMKASDVPKWKRGAMYMAVRSGGWVVWRKK